MAREFAISILTFSIIQITLCTINIEPPRQGRRNQTPESQPQSEDTFNSNAVNGNPLMSFDVGTLKNQLTSLPATQLRELADLFSPNGALGSMLNVNNNNNNADNVDEDDNLQNSMNNKRHDRRNDRRNARRRPRRRRGDCRRHDNFDDDTGFGMSRGGGGGGNGAFNGGGGGGGNGAFNGGGGGGRGGGGGGGGRGGFGYGSGMGYGSGNGMGMGEGFGYGDGGGQGYGAGMGAAGGDGQPGRGYGAGTGVGYGAAPGRVSGGKGGAGGSILGYGSGAGYANRQPYDYDESPPSSGISGTQGAMIGGGSEISGVKINSFARPAANRTPSRMANGPNRGRYAFPAQSEDQGILGY